MKYQVIRNTKYDFSGQSYDALYPNLHKYPATMLPQIGIEIFKEFNINKGTLLDPYCGSGSSFAVGLDRGIKRMYGFDINPLAVLITQVKFTPINLNLLNEYKQKLRNDIYEFVKDENNIQTIPIPQFFHIDYWFSKPVINNLAIIKFFLDKIRNHQIKRFFKVPFSETVRECSYTRNGEFKLYRMKPEAMLEFNPDVIGVFFDKLNKAIKLYKQYYYPYLTSDIKIKAEYRKFKSQDEYFDVVLTSPPYGDSRTTVAYGQFSLLSHEWLGIKNARKIDKLLMGGKSAQKMYDQGIIKPYIKKISKKSKKRAYQVSAYYFDLEKSINKVARSVKKGGLVVYVVGNRTVKKVNLPTDQFIAEKFSENSFKHINTYQRVISNKSMPKRNSPTNQKGKTVNTMNSEYIVICEKR